MPSCTVPEQNNLFTEDLFPNTSFMDLLQSAPDVGLLCNMSDEDALALPPTLPNLMTAPMSPTDDSVNVLDMVSQDMLLENNFQSTSSFASQYASSSAIPFGSVAPFTSAGDVFLPSLPITTAPNTFVKPTQSFASTSSNSANFFKPISGPEIVRPESRSDNTRSESGSNSSRYRSRTDVTNSSSQCDHTKKANKKKRRKSSSRVDNSNSTRCYSPTPTYQSKQQSMVETLHGIDKQLGKLPSSRSKSSKSRKSSKKSSAAKQSSTKTHSLTSLLESLNRSTSEKHYSRSSKSRSKRHSMHSMSPSSSSSVIETTSTRDSKVKSTAVTHTVTRPSNSACDSANIFSIDTVSKAPTQSSSHHSIYDTMSYFNPAKNKPHPLGHGPAYIKPATTCTVTSSKLSKPRAPMTIISPLPNPYSLPSSMLYSTPSIITRSAAGVSSPASTRSPATLPLSEQACDQFAAVPGQTTYLIPAASSPTTIDETSTRPRTRYVVPVTLGTYAPSTGISMMTTTATITKPRVTYAIRTNQSAYATTNTHTCTTAAGTATTTMAGHAFSQSTFSAPPSTTFYSARKVPSTRTTRSRTAAVTPESQTFAIVDEKGSYTTLTISSDFSTTNYNPAVTQTTNAITGSNVASITSDRQRNQYLIPIANSQMSTSTSLGYLLTSPVGSDIIAAHSSPATSPQGASTNASAVGSHSITTISSEALNRIRNRILIPGTAALSSYQRHDDALIDSSRSRGPVTIIANQLISAPISRDGLMPATTAAVEGTTATRTLFSAAASQGLYAITTPITTHPSSTTTGEPCGRRIIVHVSPNTQSLASTSSVAPTITTHALPANPTPGTYIISTGMASSPIGVTTPKPRLVLPSIHNPTAATTALTATTVSINTPRSLTSAINSLASTLTSTDPHSKLRSQLIITTTDSSMPGSTTPITAYTIARTRAPQNFFAIPPGPTAFTSTTKQSDIPTRSTPTMTLITFATTSAASSTTNSTRNLVAAMTHRDSLSPTASSGITATPTLKNSGNRFVIKIAANQNTTTATSSVTASVSTPITTVALNPSEQHQLVESRPISSRLRTFPSPRTYSVAQRSAAMNAQRSSVRNVNPRAKKSLTSPAPLQIFPDVVCPPATTQISSVSKTASQSKPRFPLSHSSVKSTVVMPPNKNTSSKNLSTIPNSNPVRSSPRFLTPRASSERLLLNRSVALVPPQRSSTVATTVSTMTQRTSPRLLRFTFADTRSTTESESSASNPAATKHPFDFDED